MKKVLMMAALCAAGLSACGGGGGEATPSATVAIPTTVATSVPDVVSYLMALIAATSDTALALDVSTVTLATTDTGSPDPLN